MAEPRENPAGRPPRKRIPLDAFEYYVSLGPARSYQAVAEKFGVRKRSVVKHATKEGWQERLRLLEEKARKAGEEKAQEELEEIRRRHLKGMRFIQAKAIETLRSSSLESAADAVRAYTAAVREERLMLGEPTDRTAFAVEDLLERQRERWCVAEGSDPEATGGEEAAAADGEDAEG